MGNSCSSGQGHKDKDNMSQRSEESASYQVRTSLPSEKQQTLLNHITPHSGVILEPATAGQQALQQHQQAAAPMTTASHPLEIKNPNLSKILKGASDSLSLSSPISPKGFDKLTEDDVPKEVSSLSEPLQNLVMGRVTYAKTSLKCRKIVIYVCAADSQDCIVEKGALHNVVYPALRAHCRTRGYELHIVDLHWKTLLEKQQDHEFPELCIGELTRQMEVAYVIPVLFLNNSLGTQLLPITIESADFKMALESTGNQSAQGLLKKWYTLDSDAQPPCYRLRPISCHIPGFKESSLEDREKAFEEWAHEIDKMLGVLINVFSTELRDTYLTTVVEQEVHNTVFMSQEMAKRCIWLNRVYTPTPKTPDNLSPGEAEAQRRLNMLQKDLREQLTEKHIVRIQVRYSDDGLDMDLPEHEQYVSTVTTHLRKHLYETIDSIIEEHQSKTMSKASYGVEAALFDELNVQIGFCQRAAQCSINREKTIEEIKGYVAGENNLPLIVHGPSGCGKTTLLAKIAQCCQQTLPEAFLVLRFVGISEQSDTIEQLLSSISNQWSLLAYGHKCYFNHSVEVYKKMVPSLLKASSLQRPMVVILDGLDQARDYSAKEVDWVPAKLPDNIKLIISVSEDSQTYKDLKKRLSESNFVKMPLLGETEAKNIFMSSVMQYNHSVNSKIHECVVKSVKECTVPLYAKIVAWQSSWWTDKDHQLKLRSELTAQMDLMLEELESILGGTQVQHALAIITWTKHGVTDSEMVDLLAFDDSFHSSTTYVPWAPACLAWSRLIKHLAPFFGWSLTGGVLGIRWKDELLRKAVAKRYSGVERWAHRVLFDYFNGKWWEERAGSLQARLVTQDIRLGKCYNRRKLDELPFHYHHLNNDFEDSPFISDLSWIFEKVCGSDVFQVLEDINLLPKIKNNLTIVIKDFLERHASALNYDGRQFYSHLYMYLKERLKSQSQNAKMKEMFRHCELPPVTSLIPLNCEDTGEIEDDCKYNRTCAFDLLVKLPNTHRFLVTISTDKEQICVWDIVKCEPIRILKGVPHPTNLIPIDEYRCIVLCRRELRIYDLNTGSFVTKLKGVMNQKMPYYGLHDQSHLVALSRNRMYINLMNLETGDCVTTFKAGEDRFLNSLLVSGDGRVLVCGDETQKPFPLLVWNLKSKKLLYDLRIPHHDFITSLSAITYEGNYVCCVCHEIDEPSPNFIVVYDLQSGTLFKKWKPSCNTVSLEISSPGGCVISGLEDARILVWDLITGNCRFSLSGHTAPVSCLKLDSSGGICLSSDSDCRDRSIRLWDINKGNLVSVYTPGTKISACEVTEGGRHVVLALGGHKDLVTLQLRGPDVLDALSAEETYGDQDNRGKTFDFGDEKC
ncbi:NACHT and WD repeat domain-containing protein 2 [Cylas formicarius]|uniref:NACHT and WD repeat domain-containing protein 2 n=1 Tax=Cylas formicarius TaxID=197179 RepID=UPI0029588DA9|nr:NACHT and WD repeat domain-containing protein 2 [Cylas formicarius]